MSAEERRRSWVGILANLRDTSGDASERIVEKLRVEITSEGHVSLLEHLRVCGAVPEQYPHDSSEEKLYAKYTDILVSEALNAMGLSACTISKRADAADIQARGKDFSLVADAKAFRLSRTAKNQKDFKVQAMDAWRGGLDFAVVVGAKVPSITGWR